MKRRLKYAVFAGIAMMVFVTGQPDYATAALTGDQPAILAGLDSNVMAALDDISADMIRGEALYVMFQIKYSDYLKIVLKPKPTDFFCSTSDILPANVTGDWNPSKWRYGNYGGMDWGTKNAAVVDTMDKFFQTHDNAYGQAKDSYAAAVPNYLAAVNAKYTVSVDTANAKYTVSVVNTQKAYDASCAAANKTYASAVASAKGNAAKIALALAAKTAAISKAATLKTAAIASATAAKTAAIVSALAAKTAATTPAIVLALKGNAYIVATSRRTDADKALEKALTSALPMTSHSFWGPIYSSDSKTDSTPKSNISVYMGVNNGTGSYRAMVVSEYAHRQAKVAFKYPQMNFFRNALTP
jgi:hypothetical protein